MISRRLMQDWLARPGTVVTQGPAATLGNCGLAGQLAGNLA
jgi:hypothetical protein